VVPVGLAPNRILELIGAARATFYRWYDQYQTGSPEALEDQPSQTRTHLEQYPRCDVRDRIIQLALEETKLSPGELAVGTPIVDVDQFMYWQG